jgi:DNA-binding transcriptional regulator YiaG
MQTLPEDSDLVIATRQQLGVTQDVFARLVGVSQRSVSGWGERASHQRRLMAAPQRVAPTRH